MNNFVIHKYQAFQKWKNQKILTFTKSNYENYSKTKFRFNASIHGMELRTEHDK